MDKNKLLFNKEYEDFYKMAEDNAFFSNYCEEVHGIDFSQEGFSDKRQIDEMLIIAGIKPGDKVLDIGCGNGKMAKYIGEKTGATVYGFDYSENGIRFAKKSSEGNKRLIFEEGIIGEKKYISESFDVILSVDSIYYTLDMEGVVKQIHSWLKPGGVFLVFYSEGNIMTKSKNEESTEIALTFQAQNIPYVCMDYTAKHYALLKHKRKVSERKKEEFQKNNMEFYYQCALSTSIEEALSLDEFKEQQNRYLYIARKDVNLQALEQEEEEDLNISLKIAQNKEIDQEEQAEIIIDQADSNEVNRNQYRMNRPMFNLFGRNAPRRRVFPVRRFNNNNQQ